MKSNRPYSWPRVAPATPGQVVIRLFTLSLVALIGGLPGSLATAAAVGCQEDPASPQEPAASSPANPPAARQDEARQDEARQDSGGDSATPQPDAAAKPQGNDLQSLLGQWASLETDMVNLEQQMVGEEDANKIRELRMQYIEKNGQAMLLMEQIEAAAVAEMESGNADTGLLQTMTGLVMNHAAFDRDAQALDLGQKMIDAGVDPQYFATAATADRLPPQAKEVVRELSIRSVENASDDLPRVKLTTSKGDIVLELFENEAPQTVGNFVSLVEDGFYDGLTFHRVLENFMAQGGDPNGDGTGGPGYNIYCECYQSDFRRHFTGSLSMAKQVPRDTGGSQFFITFSRTSDLDGKHTVFGRVVEGMDVVNNIQRINPQDADRPQPDRIEKAEVVRKRDHEYQPTKVNK